MTAEAMATLAQAQALLPGSTLVGDGSTAFARVHTDTRTLQPGDLFVALKGEHHDGHDHLAAAAAAGAVAAIAERSLGPLSRSRERAGGEGASTPPTLPTLVVPDTLAALQTLATNWRAQFDLPLVAVTGSNGKTTVTQMTAAILRAWLGDAALATAGNFNNHIGVPLTLLRLRATHRAAVVELGMNHPGEIALLARIAAPTVALVNNAQREHLEFMTDIASVARENGSVIAHLPSGGCAVLPAADAHTPLWRAIAGARRVVTFALDNDAGDDCGTDGAGSARLAADVSGTATWQADGGHWRIALRTPIGETATTLRQPGRHNAANALAAAACAHAAGAPLAAIARGIADFTPVAGRSQLLTLRRGARTVTLVDDSYNANPDSVIAAIDQLAALPGPRWLVLGDMGEVGSTGPQLHAEVGAHARRAGIEQVWTAGTLAAHAGAPRHFATVDALLEALAREGAPAAASILVKGSRFMKMERVVRAVAAEGAAATAEGAAHAA